MTPLFGYFVIEDELKSEFVESWGTKPLHVGSNVMKNVAWFVFIFDAGLTQSISLYIDMTISIIPDKRELRQPIFVHI